MKEYPSLVTADEAPIGTLGPAQDPAPGGRPAVSPGTTARAEREMSQASLLVEIARTEAELFHTPTGESHARVEVAGRREVWPIRSEEFQDWLARRFYHPGSEAPRATARQDALGMLESLAREGIEHAVFARKAEHAGAIYLDLASDPPQAVRITSEGWQLIPEAPVRFRRARGMLPLPVPVRGGTLDELRPFLNTAGEGDFRLLVTWLLAALGPHQPTPLLSLHGEPGSARSTTARVLCRLADPHQTLLARGPRRLVDLSAMAGCRLMVGLENLRTLPGWLSDALYCLSAGSALAPTPRFTGDGAAGCRAVRPVVWTSLAEVATEPDLLERTVSLRLPVIPEADRRTEAEFWTAFETAYPRLLGALLDGVAAGLRHLPETRPQRLPGMPDFARWGCAVEAGLGWEAGSFLAAYRETRGEATSAALEGYPLAQPILALVADVGEWTGICRELLAVLVERAGDAPGARKGWPGTPEGLSHAVRRLAPHLRAAGVAVTFPVRTRSGQPVCLSPCERSGAGEAPGEGSESRVQVDAPMNARLEQLSPVFVAGDAGVVVRAGFSADELLAEPARAVEDGARARSGAPGREGR